MNVSDHVALDELADAAGGSVDPERGASIDAHLAECGTCRAQVDALRQVSVRLAAEPRPVMPPDVFARLQTAVAEESAVRTGRVVPLATYHPRPTLGTFGADLHRPSRRRWAGPLLAAAAAATLVGFGGYVLSASVGLNEPPAVSAAVRTGDLGTQAGALRKVADLSPHRFSRAWQCARQVTDGRIVGLASTNVDGGPALLVYTREDGQTEVTVVTGCATESPTAGPSAPVTR